MLDPQAGPSGRQIALAPAFVLSLLVVPKGKRKLEQYLAALMDVQSGWGLSSRMRILVADMRAQWRELDRRITAFDAVCACRRGQAGGSCSRWSLRCWPISRPPELITRGILSIELAPMMSAMSKHLGCDPPVGAGGLNLAGAGVPPCFGLGTPRGRPHVRSIPSNGERGERDALRQRRPSNRERGDLHDPCRHQRGRQGQQGRDCRETNHGLRTCAIRCGLRFTSWTLRPHAPAACSLRVGRCRVVNSNAPVTLGPGDCSSDCRATG